MRLTIIPEDKVVIINGVGRYLDFTVDENYHAIQWAEGEYGYIETKTGSNIKLENLDEFSAIIAAHAALLADEAAARLAYETDPARKVERLADVRYIHEIGGVEVEGIRFWTTRDSIPAWQRMVEAAKANPDYIVPAYKAMSGFVANLTAAQILAADVIGQNHITKCYAAEFLTLAEIDTIELADIEAEFMNIYAAVEL